jgi:hypothetical protein
MIQSILNTLFGCAHQRTTFPLTPLRKNGGFPVPTHRNGAYVVCLDCGKEFSYDWKEMRVGDAVSVMSSSATERAAAPVHISTR